jgi:ornithine cyclodeaminase
MSGRTGETLAVLDGTRLTHWRTAAASALAARLLARADTERLLVVGAGARAPFLVRAHASVRRYRSIAVWNHRPEGARRLAADLSTMGFNANPAADLEAAVAEADVISCATLATEPLIQGRWLKPGQHLDLVGAFNVSMREADDEALRRAHIFIDTDAALTEGGDVAAGILGGVIDRSAVIANLPALCRGAPGRRRADEITLFKSVGAAIEDLAAAILVWRKSGGVAP